MSQPFDLDAVIVEADEAEPFTFTWGGKEFQLPAFMSLPADRQIAIIDLVGAKTLDAATLLVVLRAIIGNLIDELSAISGGPSRKPLNTMRLMHLISAWINSQRVDPGKSPASPASSVNTAPKSKPTSRSGRARRTS